MNLAAIIFTGRRPDHRMQALDNASDRLRAAFDAFAGSGRSTGETVQPSLQLIAIATAASETISYRLDKP